MSGSAGKKDNQGRWAAAVAALLTAPSIAAAASQVGVSEQTVRRWLKNARFLRLYRAARRAVVETAVGRVQQAAGGAIDALVRNLTCDRPAVEVRAAEVILDQAVRGVELTDVLERVEELEALVGELTRAKSEVADEQAGEVAGHDPVGPGGGDGAGEDGVGEGPAD